MRDTKRFVSRRNDPLVNINCPHCGGKFRIFISKLEMPAACLLCSGIVEHPAEHYREPIVDKLKIPLRGSIITDSGTVDLEEIEAESDAYTGGRNAFEREHDNPAAIMAARAQEAADANMVGRPPSNRHTGRIRASRTSVITVVLVSLMVVGLIVFVWQMIVRFGQPQ
ncbi:MAG: hypothetical protein IT462_02770 [Planctomycetes bacterium]|nr:hypothetical protein [Planctomycetota bacterium]